MSSIALAFCGEDFFILSSRSLVDSLELSLLFFDLLYKCEATVGNSGAIPQQLNYTLSNACGLDSSAKSGLFLHRSKLCLSAIIYFGLSHRNPSVEIKIIKELIKNFKDNC
jgi:hypothetical protein